MHDLDLAWWGEIVVPLGVVICFGPALLVWFREEMNVGPDDKPKQDNKQ